MPGCGVVPLAGVQLKPVDVSLADGKNRDRRAGGVDGYACRSPELNSFTPARHGYRSNGQDMHQPSPDPHGGHRAGRPQRRPLRAQTVSHLRCAIRKRRRPDSGRTGGRPERLSSPPRRRTVMRRHTKCALRRDVDRGLDRFGGLLDAAASGRRLDGDLESTCCGRHRWPAAGGTGRARNGRQAACPPRPGPHARQARRSRALIFPRGQRQCHDAPRRACWVSTSSGTHVDMCDRNARICLRIQAVNATLRLMLVMVT
jgi:hypothetical protein